MKQLTFKQKVVQGIHDLFYIWKQEFRTTFRDQGVLIFFVLVPLVYPLIYSFIYTNETIREVPTVVVDNSRSSLSREYLRKVDASPETSIVAHCAETERSQKLDITVKYQEGMTDGDYLLPIILKEVEGMPFEVNAGTCYLPISLTDGMIQIKPTDSDITTNSSPKTIGKLIDGGVGEGLFWESYYYTVEGLESYCDPTYGIYVDISNLDKKITKAMKIRLSAYAWHTLATKAKVYAKTVSNPEWTLIKTNDDAEEIAPVFPNAKKKTNYLLELDGGHIRDLDYQDCGEVTAVRIAFLESKKGTLTDITAANVGSKLVGLAEIEIFGY